MGEIVDVVAVFTGKYKQVFPKARTIVAMIIEDSRTMDYPLETGAITTDHRVILPTEIQLTLMLNSADYRNVYNDIRSYWANGTTLIVQTKTTNYPDQLIVSLPHQESAEYYNAIPLTLNMKQVLYVGGSGGGGGIAPANSKYNTTVPTGSQQPQPATAIPIPSSVGISTTPVVPQ